MEYADVAGPYRLNKYGTEILEQLKIWPSQTEV